MLDDFLEPPAVPPRGILKSDSNSLENKFGIQQDPCVRLS